MTAKKCDAYLFLEGMYGPMLLMGHGAKLISQLPEAFRRRQQCVDDLLINRKSGGFDSLLSNMLEKTTGVGAAMWGTKKHNTDCGLKDVSEVGLAPQAAARSPQHLFDDYPSQAVYHEQCRSQRLGPTLSL